MVRYRIDLIESKCGQRNKVNKVIYFDTEKEAYKFQNKFNATKEYVPKHYTYATKPEMEVVK